MSLEEQQSSERYENWRKATLATKCLKKGITGPIDEHVEQQHNDMLSYIQKKFGIAPIACKSCSLRTVLPLHTKDSNGKCSLGNPDCNCLNTKDRKVCPTRFCSAMYEQIILQHRYRSPNWTNTDITQWHENHWEIGKCYISVNGYKKKTSAEKTDCSGLIHVVINNMAVQSVLDCVIDPPHDVFSKTKEARNEMMHSADMELDDTQFQMYIEDMIAILEDKKLFDNRPEALAAKQELQKLKECNVKLPKCTVCDDGKHILDMLNKKKQDALEAIEKTTQTCIAKVRSIGCKCEKTQNVTKQPDIKISKQATQQENNNSSFFNSNTTDSVTTSTIVTEYISYRIQKAGFNYQVPPTRNCPDNKVISAVKKLCGDFENQFFEMCSHSMGIDINLNAFESVLNEVIIDGINWGKVVAVVTFAGCLSVCCMENGRYDQVDWIRNWTCQFIESRVETWIIENNGWQGLVDWFFPDEDKGTRWKHVLPCLLGGIIVGAIILKKE